MSDEKFDIPFKSDLVPKRLELDAKIQFRCHKGISCFNACCRHADVTLTPYDIIRLKKHFNMGSSDFLVEHTVPFEIDRDGLPGVKLKVEDGGTCIFMNDEGCSVYADRPTVCRYYPLGHLSMREKDSPDDTQHFSLIKESHCKGHEEDRELTIADYRKEQDVEIYDHSNRGWLQLMLKKRSAGPTIGKPSDLSLQLYFMALYDIDRFRRFIDSDGFKTTYALEPAHIELILKDDDAAIEFGYAFLKQILYGEPFVAEHEGAFEKRLEERREIMEMRLELEKHKAREKDDQARREVTESH